MADAPSRIRLAVAAVVITAACAAIGVFWPRSDGSSADRDPSQPEPEIGQCRALSGTDLNEPANQSPLVDCATAHTAETFWAGTFDLPATTPYDDPQLELQAYTECTQRFGAYIGADESLSMRTVLSWTWFRPTSADWTAGARWFRCDVIQPTGPVGRLVELPETTEGLLAGPPDDSWLVCADGPSVTEGVRVPCTEPHTWRAVTTIKLGEPVDPYPGDEVVEKRTREYCSESVSAWLNYPVTFDFGFTWFGEDEWDGGNRRSICWASTDR